jgi:NADH:ubiquinone oxidoreductase subunit E
MQATLEKARDYTELDSYINSVANQEGMLITVLHKAQGIFGYLPREVQEHIALKMKIPTSKVYGVVTFYSFFHMEPLGKVDINLCLGTACFVRGAGKILEEFEQQLGISVGEVTDDGLFSINTLRCVGACSLAPVAMINGKTYGRLKPEDVKGIVESYMEKEVA